MNMFDEVAEVTLAGGEVVRSRRVSDKEIAEMEMTKASAELATVEAEWDRLDRSPVTVEKWNALERRYEADKKCWELFTGGVKGNVKLNEMYNAYRLILIRGGRADA